MKANELRIGNFVEGPLGEVAQITQLGHKDNSNYIEAKNEFFHGQNGFSPIPLTEEWLLKFGFEKTDDYGDQIYYERKTEGSRGYYVCFDHEEWVFGLSVRNECTCLIYDEPHFQHVHQLQNLYFALTGKELTLKEP